ncbi:MAG: repair protein RecO [Dehalococcoidia bacterium]|nr:repair protein RecO [Dehalococcoidia bacterium]
MTTPPKIYSTEAIVLKHTPLGEADYLLTMYTPNRGKTRAVAKGARRVKSRLGGHLEPLMRASLLMARGQNLDVVSQAEALEGFRTVREDLQRVSQALCMAELVDAITPEEQPNYPIYRLFLESLRRLEGDAPPSLMPFFQLHLLEQSGFRPELYRCVECDSTLAPGLHRFAPDRGGTLCVSCHPPGLTILPLSLDTLKVLRFLQREVYNIAARLHLEPGTLLEMERLLGALLRCVLEREVKASRFLHQVSQDDRERAEAAASPANNIKE